MEGKETVVSRGSVELIVLGLLAALVVALAFPMLSRLEKKPVATNEAPPEDTASEIPVD